MASAQSNTPVLIVGAGPTGLVAALTLLINGIRPRVIDSGSGERYGSKALIITPRSQELYQSLGVLQDILAVARPTPNTMVYKPGSMELMSHRNIFLEGTQATPDCPHAIGLSLAQGRLEKIMYSHLKTRFDFEPEFDTSLSSFDEQEDHVVVHLERRASTSAEVTRETAQVGYIIGADGGRSSVRKKLGLPFEGVTLPGVMLYGDVQAEGVDPDIWHVWGDASSLLVALWPIDDPSGAAAFRCFGANLSDERATELAKNPDALSRLVEDHIGLPSVKLGSWVSLTNFRTNVRMVPSFSSPSLRIFLAGDAAHTHSPAGGQGLNSSVLDAANLSWKLALVVRGHAHRSLLESYSAERVPVIRAMLAQTTAELKRVEQWAVKDKVAQVPADFTQLGVHYKDSALVFDEFGDDVPVEEPTDPASFAVKGRQLRAGNRAPDASGLVVLSGADEGSETTLFDGFNLSTHTALVFVSLGVPSSSVMEAITALQPARTAGLFRVVVVHTTSHPEVAIADGVDRELLDTAGHAMTAYAPDRLGPFAVAIIRPDQVIGAFTSTPAGIHRYVSSILTGCIGSQ